MYFRLTAKSSIHFKHDERLFLLSRERPAVVEVVAWAASNGDRSENADYSTANDG